MKRSSDDAEDPEFNPQVLTVDDIVATIRYLVALHDGRRSCRREAARHGR